jgi:TPR repeat protein
MRRQNVQLIALARQGDTPARREVGRRYLLGIEGFPRHLQTGIDYLTHASLRHDAQAARIVAEVLPLQDIVERDLVPLLVRAAGAGCVAADLKYAVWLLATQGDEVLARRHLAACATAGHRGALRALHELQAPGHADGRPALQAVLRGLGSTAELDVADVALIAARAALDASDLDRLLDALAAAFDLRTRAASAEVDELVVQAVRLAETLQHGVARLTAQQIEDSLDRRAHAGDAWAAYTLGRALCGIDCGAIAATQLSTANAVRRGTALLFRAADAGCTDAWLHLYRLHSDQRLSVANSQMARFCLEKAALAGQSHAQTKLGALMLRAAGSLAQSEQAIAWLHKAWMQGDAHALELLRSLHLPVHGADAQARRAIEDVRHDHPWLAMRMQLARDFGLTKLEALCVDPVDGQRPWGLVVGRNPFVVQSRLSAPRAIPALTQAALDNLQRTAMMFTELGRDGYALEGDARRRSLVQRRAFERLQLDEAMFFAKARTQVLDTLRQGPRWAFRARTQLQVALAA